MNEIIQPHPNAVTQNPEHSSAPLTATLSLAQIQQAMADRLATYQASKLEFADGMRECCRDLPMGTPLTIANHVVERVHAGCVLHCVKRPESGTEWHTQAVLLVDGKMLVEPLFEEERTFREGYTDFCEWFRQGSKDGWVSAEAKAVYDREHALWLDELRDSGVDYGDEPADPPSLAICDIPTMQEVAQALPEAMAAWHMQRHHLLAAQTIKNNALATELKR